MTGDDVEVKVKDVAFSAREDGLVRDDQTGEVVTPPATPLSVRLYISSWLSESLSEIICVRHMYFLSFKINTLYIHK
jgi:hypothetical protein